MGYLPMGSDDATSSTLSFNSTKYPGVCKPSNFYTLGLFRQFQEQLNRVAQIKGFGKVTVDGDIGAGTVSLAAAAGVVPAGTSCKTVAYGVILFTAAVRAQADAGRAPASVPGKTAPVATVLVLPDGSTGAVVAPTSGFLGQLSTPLKLSLIVLALGGGYLVATSKKKRRR